MCGCWARLAWDVQIDGRPGSSVSRRDRLPRLPPSARAAPPGPRRPCEQRQQQRGRPRWCSCSAGARAARSCAGTWQHRDVDADRRAPSQRCLASRGGARAPLAARRSLGRRRGGRGGQRSRGHRPWEVAGPTLKTEHAPFRRGANRAGSRTLAPSTMAGWPRGIGQPETIRVVYAHSRHISTSCSLGCSSVDVPADLPVTRPSSRTRVMPALEPWCVEVSRVSGGVGQCRGSVEAVSVDTGVGVSGSVGLQCRGSVRAP